MKKFLIAILVLGCSLQPHFASAKCKKIFTGTPSADVTGGAPLTFGLIRLIPDEFQPVGLISVTHASPTQVTGITFIPTLSDMMFQCDLEDKGKTFEMFATNGDSNVGGHNEVDRDINGGNVYQTFFPRIGIKIIHDKSGLPFTRYWQKYPITGHEVNGKLNFYLNDFSSVTAELYKLSHTDRSPASASWGCKGPAVDGYQGNITCHQPNAYTAFLGPGWNDDRNAQPGTDSDTHWGGFSGGTNWIGFGMNYSLANRLYQTSFGCRVFDYTKLVNLPAVTVSQLENGESLGAPFNVTYKCEGTLFIDTDVMFNKLISGHSGIDILGNLSIAFMVANAGSAYDSYHPFGNAVPYLISDNTGQPGYATNVGITISSSGSSQSLLFLLHNSYDPYDDGWYPMNTGLQSIEKTGRQRMVHSSFYASYARIDPSKPVLPGKVDASAYILVRYQ